jgi:hypothetical protein
MNSVQNKKKKSIHAGDGLQGKHATNFLLYVVGLLFGSRPALPQLCHHLIACKSHANNFLFFFLQRKLQFGSRRPATLKFACSLHSLKLLYSQLL